MTSYALTRINKYVRRVVSAEKANSFRFKGRKCLETHEPNARDVLSREKSLRERNKREEKYKKEIKILFHAEGIT